MYDAKRSHAVAFASVEILVQNYDTVSATGRLQQVGRRYQKVHQVNVLLVYVAKYIAGKDLHANNIRPG